MFIITKVKMESGAVYQIGDYIPETEEQIERIDFIEDDVVLYAVKMSASFFMDFTGCGQCWFAWREDPPVERKKSWLRTFFRRGK